MFGFLFNFSVEGFGWSSLWRTKELRAKGYDCAVLGMWLCDELGGCPDYCNDVYSLVWAAIFFFTVLHSKDFYPDKKRVKLGLWVSSG